MASEKEMRSGTSVKKSEYDAVLGTLTVDYDCIAMLDFDTDTTKDYVLSSKYGKLSTPWREKTTIAERMRKFAEESICEEDRAYYLQCMTRDNILKQLEHEKVYNINYRIVQGDKLCYLQVSSFWKW